MRAKNLLVVLVSTLVGLLLWEAGLRLFTGYGPHGAAQPASVPAEPPNVADAARYIRRLTGASQSGPALVCRGSSALAEPDAGQPRRDRPLSGFRAPRSLRPSGGYVWNSYLVKRDRCNPAGLFRNFPDTLLAFTPESVIHPSGLSFPRQSNAGIGVGDEPVRPARPSDLSRQACPDNSDCLSGRFHHRRHPPVTHSLIRSTWNTG